MNRFFPIAAAGILSSASLLWVGCRNQGAAAAAAQGSAPVQVIVVQAQRRPVAENLSLIGTIAANEMVEIKSETDGTVQEILVQEGEEVRKGQLLIHLDESKLAAGLGEAQASFELSQANFERSQQLFRDKLISRQEFDQAASAFALNRATVALRQRELQDTRIVASFSGAVGARNISPGQVISKNTPLTWLVSFDPVKVEFNVPEKFLGQLQKGQHIDVMVAAYPGRTFKGEVYFVSPFVDEKDRTALVKALIANRKNELKPGMFANLDLTLMVRGNAVVIPEAALSQVLDNSKAKVFIADAAKTAQVRDVVLGVRIPGQVEIRQGLQGGEAVIVEGVQKIGPGSKVSFAPPEEAKIYVENDRVNAK